MAQTDPNAPDWWASNGINVPPPGPMPPVTQAPPGTQATADQVAQWYQGYLGRAATPEEIQAQLQGGSGDANTIRQSIASSPEAQTYSHTTTAHTMGDPAGNGGAAPTLNRNDPASVAAYVKWYSTQPGANPSLANDPNYWIGKISSGELGEDPAYIVQKFMLPEGAQSGGGNQFAGFGGGSTTGFGAPPAPYASNPNAPTYTQPQLPANLQTPFTPGTFTPGTFHTPTLEQAKQDPGYQFGLDESQRGIEHSAAAQGSVLNPGTVQALSRNANDYATTKYNDVYGRDLSTFNTNEGNQFSAFNMNTANQFGARQQQQGEFQQNVLAPAQQTYSNNYGQYLNENARTLNDYLQNYNIGHTAQTDYWSRLKDVSGAGLTGALNSRAPTL